MSFEGFLGGKNARAGPALRLHGNRDHAHGQKRTRHILATLGSILQGVFEQVDLVYFSTHPRDRHLCQSVTQTSIFIS